MTAHNFSTLTIALLFSPLLLVAPAHAVDQPGTSQDKMSSYYRPTVLGRGRSVGTMMVIMQPPTSLNALDQKLAAKGISVRVVWADPDVERASETLRAIDGPVFLAGYSRGGRVAMTLAAFPEFHDKVKGSVLFAPQVKTMQAAWSDLYKRGILGRLAGQGLIAKNEKLLPDHQTVQQVVNLDRPYFHRTCYGFECFDEHLQETNVRKPTLLFYGLADPAISQHYVRRVVTDEPTNTGIRAFFFEGVGHHMPRFADELITTEICSMLNESACPQPRWNIASQDRITTIAPPPEWTSWNSRPLAPSTRSLEK